MRSVYKYKALAEPVSFTSPPPISKRFRRDLRRLLKGAATEQTNPLGFRSEIVDESLLAALERTARWTAYLGFLEEPSFDGEGLTTAESLAFTLAALDTTSGKSVAELAHTCDFLMLTQRKIEGARHLPPLKEGTKKTSLFQHIMRETPKAWRPILTKSYKNWRKRMANNPLAVDLVSPFVP